MPFPSSPTNGQLANINNISYSYSSATGAWSKTSLGTANVSLLTSNGGTISGPITLASTLTFAAGNVTNPSVTFVGSTSSGLYAPGSNSLAIATNGANAIVINSSQNVGIGTTSPSEALTVSRSAGEAVIGIRNTGSASSWLTLAPSSSGAAYIHNTSNVPTIFTTNSIERMRLDASGNAGIGIPSPATRLQVTTSSATNNFTRLNNTISQIDIGQFANGLCYSGYANTDVITGTSTASQWQVFTNGVQRAEVDAFGNLGINETTPTALLHIGPGGVAQNQMQFDPTTVTTVLNRGAMEYDGNVFYLTPDTTSGKAVINARQIMYMTSDLGPLGTGITNFFGAASAVNCLADHTYLIEAQLIFTKNTAGSVTLTLYNSQTPAQVNILTKGVNSNFDSTVYDRVLIGSTATNAAITTGSIADARTSIVDFRATLETNVSSNSWVKIQSACGAGTYTVKRGSWWSITKLQGNTGTSGNTGAFFAGA